MEAPEDRPLRCRAWGPGWVPSAPSQRPSQTFPRFPGHCSAQPPPSTCQLATLELRFLPFQLHGIRKPPPELPRGNSPSSLETTLQQPALSTYTLLGTLQRPSPSPKAARLTFTFTQSPRTNRVLTGLRGQGVTPARHSASRRPNSATGAEMLITKEQGEHRDQYES